MTSRARLAGLLATVLLAGILVGLPTALLALGANPIPRALPNLEQIRAAVTTPDDGTLALSAIKVLAWAAWAVLAGAILLEIGSRLRGVRAPRLPGLRLPQVAAGRLVGAAALLFVMVPAATAVAEPAAAAPAAPTSTASHTEAAPRGAPESNHRTYTVRPGDTLSGIARRELSDPQRWPDLAHLNPEVAAHPNRIEVGTVLRLPDRSPAGPARTYAVKAGDTLSGIARRELGDARQYPAIFEASKGTLQPGGTHLSDPDRITVGQKLTIPAPAPTPPSAPVTVVPPPVTPPPAPRPDVDEQTRSPGAPAPPSPVPTGATQHPPSASEVTAPGEHATQAPWMLAGLTGAGALLAGSLLTLLRRRRRAQVRNRRPGRTLPSPEPVLRPVEKTITAVGSLTAPTVEHVDAVLRRLAAAAARDGSTMPDLAAVELTGTRLALHLGAAAHLPHPWTGTDDGYHWTITPGTDLDTIGPDTPDQPAPYPLLVTIGAGDHDEVWLLNVEDLDVTITGDPTYGQDFARYLAAEVACNPWSAGVDVACLGVATELVALNPDRIHVYDPQDRDLDPISERLAAAVRTIDAAEDTGTDVTTARARQAGADAWPARLLLIDAATDDPALDELLDLVHTHPGYTATSVIIRGHRPRTPGTVLEVTADGRVNLPEAGLNLIAVGLTSDEAQGCAALLAHSEALTEAPVPVDADATDGWRSWSDEAGALRAEHTLPRSTPPASPETDATGAEDPTPVSSLLEEDDATYTHAAATTSQDLQALAPRVSDTVRRDVQDSDPTLDADLAMWFRDDCPLPRLRLLGPVRATTRGKPLTKRKPYMTELLAFIVLRRLGATPEEVAETFTITKPKARDYVLTVRQWLGTNPRTGQPHLPDARLAPAATIRGVPVYQVVDLLVDIDLFRRLRVRGQARGAAGIEDLRTALTLVQGRPFDYPLERGEGGGWSWLVDNDRLDEHMAVAVVDVAHIVTTHALAQADLPTARLAAETAALAAPHEEIPRLDLAAVAAAEGHHAEAQRIIRDEVCNRTDDEGAPPELPARTEQILHNRKGWAGTKVS